MSEDYMRRLGDELAFAMHVAAGAGARVLDLAKRGRWQGKVLAEIGDNAADGYIVGRLHGRYPNDGLLSEETADSADRLRSRRVWIIDPIDGSVDYGRGGPDWAIHIALAIDGELCLGAVGLPAEGRVIGGICVPGYEVFVMDGPGELFPASTAPQSRMRIAFSKNHPPIYAAALARSLNAEIRNFGGVGYKVSRVLLGEADAYMTEHDFSLNEWDVAAPEAIARALGWSLTTLDGRHFEYNQKSPVAGSVLLCRPIDRDRLIATVKDHIPKSK